MKWEMPKPNFKSIPRYWRIERVSWRYNDTENKYILSGVTTPYDGFTSKRDARRTLDNIEADAKARIGEIGRDSGEYAHRTSTDDLHVCIYGNKFHFKITGL